MHEDNDRRASQMMTCIILSEAWKWGTIRDDLKCFGLSWDEVRSLVVCRNDWRSCVAWHEDLMSLNSKIK